MGETPDQGLPHKFDYGLMFGSYAFSTCTETARSMGCVAQFHL